MKRGPAGRAGLGPAAAPALLAALATLIAAAAPDAVSEQGPEPGHTGGFGEPTCRSCHFDGPERPDDASVTISGLPAEWTAGKDYPIEIVVRGENVRRGGFQLAVRHVEGGAAGRQAGRLTGAPERVAVTELDGVAYIHHVAGSTRPDPADEFRWRVVWSAPAAIRGRIAFHVAANAANDDNSEFGDRIVTAADTVRAAVR